jgi:hypothetical protein
MTTPSGNKNVDAIMCIPVLSLLVIFEEYLWISCLTYKYVMADEAPRIMLIVLNKLFTTAKKVKLR